MRTDSEIVVWYEARRGDDFFGTIGGDVLGTLSFDAARPFLNEKATADDWTVEARDDAAVIERMRDYMSFAWDKATNHRGLSASRSVDHFRAWLFLVGDDELLAFADSDENYRNYGVPILLRICDKYGFDVPEGVRHMADGAPCTEHCGEGCSW